MRGMHVKHKDIPANDRLIFAMDVPDCDRARSLADELGDLTADAPLWFWFTSADARGVPSRIT